MPECQKNAQSGKKNCRKWPTVGKIMKLAKNSLKRPNLKIYINFYSFGCYLAFFLPIFGNLQAFHPFLFIFSYFQKKLHIVFRKIGPWVGGGEVCCLKLTWRNFCFRNHLLDSRRYWQLTLLHKNLWNFVIFVPATRKFTVLCARRESACFWTFSFLPRVYFGGGVINKIVPNVFWTFWSSCRTTNRPF